jgi:hypothetical protein
MSGPIEPYAPFIKEMAAGRADLDQMQTLAQEGLPPGPEKLNNLQRRCQDNLHALAARLGLGQVDEADLDPAGLEAFDRVLRLGMEVNSFRLELARRHGPEYLPPKPEGPA